MPGLRKYQLQGGVWKPIYTGDGSPTVTPPPTPPPTQTYPIVGSSVNGEFYNRSWSQQYDVMSGAGFFEGDFPPRIFSSGGIGNWTSGNLGVHMNRTAGLKTPCAYSWKTRDRAAARAFMRAKPDDGRVVDLIYNHEPDNDVKKSNPNASYQERLNYAHAHRDHLVELWTDWEADGARPDIRFWTAYVRQIVLNRNGEVPWQEWVPYLPDGRVALHGYGVDAYNVGGKNDVYASIPNMLTPVQDVAGQLGLPWGIFETGSDYTSTDTTGAGRNDWILSYADYVAANGGTRVYYWNRRTLQPDAQGNFTDYRLEYGPRPSVPGWRARINTSRTANWS